MLARILLATLVLTALPVFSAYAETVALVSHEVKDFDAWKKGFDGDKANRKKAGLKDLFVVRDAEKPNLVHLGFSAASADKIKAFMDNPKLKEIMDKAGVISKPEVKMGELVKK